MSDIAVAARNSPKRQICEDDMLTNLSNLTRRFFLSARAMYRNLTNWQAPSRRSMNG